LWNAHEAREKLCSAPHLLQDENIRMLNKHSDPIPELTLPKWPFIIGDLCLVCIALAIAILGDWQLTNSQVVACVLSVALGAVLFIVPFVVEFQAREQEQMSVPSEQIEIVARHVKDLEARAAVMANQLGRLEQETTSKKEQPSNSFETAALQTLEDRITQQAKELKAAQVSLEELSAQHATHLAEPVLAAPEPKPDPMLLARLEQLEDKLSEPSPAKISTPKVIQSEAKREAILEAKAEAKAVLKNAAYPKPAAEAEPLQESQPKAKTALTKPNPEPRIRKQAESNLLKRAIQEKKDGAAQAVGRIIEAKTPLVIPENNPKPEGFVPEKVQKEMTAPDPIPVPATAPDDAAVQGLKPDATPLKLPPSEPDAKTKTSFKEPEAVIKAEPILVPETKAEAKPTPKPERVAPAVEVVPDTLFDTDAVAPKSVKHRTKKKDSVCTVHTLIGIGNKPYLRGSGGGLNWDSGIVMEFEAIGKWRWTAPADLDQAIEVQVYRNDEDPDTSGRHSLQAGDKLEINAKF
jgi:hypothetical protein